MKNPTQIWFTDDAVFEKKMIKTKMKILNSYPNGKFRLNQTVDRVLSRLVFRLYKYNVILYLDKFGFSTFVRS